MFRRKTKPKTSLVLQSSNRGSDITKPDNTSLIVNESKSSYQNTEAAKALSSILSEEDEEEEEVVLRPSSSLLNSMSQKHQSTPKSDLAPVPRILKPVNEVLRISPLKKTPKKSLYVSRKDLSYFEQVISECGANKLSGNGSYSLSQDQAVFSIKVNSILNENKTVEDFKKSLQEHISNMQNLMKMLMPTQTANDCENARGPVQDPLMRLLLNVECLQSSILQLLLEKLANIIIDSNAESDNLQIVSPILRQIRFLNRPKGSKLAEELFQIIDVAPVHLQRELIFMLPEIITEEENEEATVQLLELLKSNSSLTHVIIDALTNLPLTSELRSQVRNKILKRLDKCPTEHLPLFVQFIITRCEGTDLTDVINSLREDLPFTMQHHELREAEKRNSTSKRKISDEDSYLKLTFENIKYSVMTSKQMVDAWMKILTNINTPDDFRCVDVVMLLIVYNNVFGRKAAVLSIIRNKVKSDVLTETHFQHLFKLLHVVAVEYSNTILEIASSLLKSYEQVIADSAMVIYEAAFVHYNSYLRQNVISEILLHIGTGTPGNVNVALTVLCHLAEKNLPLLAEHTVCIMGVLLKLPDLEPGQVRQLIDIIANLIFSGSSDDTLGLQDELQMLIRKQLASSKLEQHNKGVVAAVMYTKHAVSETECENFPERMVEATSLLEMALGSNSNCEARRAFFNDEMATMLRDTKLDDRFLETWKDRTYRYVYDNMFVRDLDLESQHFPMALQYSVDFSEDSKVVFPIVGFVIKNFENSPMNMPLGVMPSALRLLWCSEADLSNISNMLSAGVIMPDLIVLDKFRSLDDSQQKMVLDSLFLCCNYFVECINGFCNQKISEKVLIRLKQLIEVRKIITKLIHHASDYVPPSCQSYAAVAKPTKPAPKKKSGDPKKNIKKGKKRKSDGEPAESTSQSVLDSSELPGTSASLSVEIIGHQSVAAEEADLHMYRGYLRELHLNTYKLLRTELTLTPSKVFKKMKMSDLLVTTELLTYRPIEKPELGPSDLLFLLDDFIRVSTQILKDNKRWTINHKSKSEASLITHIAPEIFIQGSVKLLGKLCVKMELLGEYCERLIEASDGVLDAPGMFPKDSADIKLCLVAALRVVTDVLAWHGFQSPGNRSLLKDALTVVSRQTNIDFLPTAALEAGKYLASYKEKVLLLSGGLSIVKGVEACFKHCVAEKKELDLTLAGLCYDMLSRPWYTVSGLPDRGTAFNHHVDILLRTYFSRTDQKMKVVKNIAGMALEEVENLSGKESTMETFKTINKSNFPLLYRATCEALVTAATAELNLVQDDHPASLAMWKEIFEIHSTLVDIVKLQSSRLNLSALLKRSQSIIHLFLSKGMPVMESALRVTSAEVCKVLKSLQVVTRFLHYICCHSKITSDALVAVHVPFIRSLCERINLEVKGMLILNKIPLDCINFAVLKNKDLQGNDVFSQQEGEDSEEIDSELPPDSDTTGNVESNSEIF